MKYIVCVYGNFQNRDSVLRNTLASGEYVVGETNVPDVLKNANVGDVLLLSVDQKIIAYGKVLKPLEVLPNPDKYWKQHLVVEKWFVLDSIDPNNGISTKGISFACETPDKIAKEVQPEWFLERLLPVFTAALVGLEKNRFELPVESVTVASECGNETVQQKSEKMSFGKAVGRFWKGYFNFSGRATRSEFWFAILLNTIVVGIIFLCIADYVQLAEICGGNASMTGNVVAFFLMISNLWGLAIIFPFLALYARRFHDTDRSAWNLLWLFVALPVACVLIPVGNDMLKRGNFGTSVLFFILGIGLGLPALCKLAALLFAKSTKERNRFGDPV